jgi:hypothetical protein
MSGLGDESDDLGLFRSEMWPSDDPLDLTRSNFDYPTNSPQHPYDWQEQIQRTHTNTHMYTNTGRAIT